MPPDTSTKSQESLAESLRKIDMLLEMLIAPGLWPASGDSDRDAEGAVRTSAEGVRRPGDLPYQVTRAYDLSVSRALEASIPVVGSGSLGAQRRVIVLERVGYDERTTPDGVTEQVGFAIRLCITINKLDANVKLSLPFITASAQLGATEAVWTLQIMGLRGTKIAAVEIVPTELNVETFVLAKQSLQELIKALIDTDTILEAKVIARQWPPVTIEDRYVPLVAQGAALGAISRGWSMQDAASRFHWDLSQTPATFAGVYQDVAGIMSIADRPTREAMGKAARLLGTVNINPR